jgi:Gpi18-like mannosyltransferase
MSVLGTRSKQLTMTTPRAVTQSRAVFIATSGIIYAITIIAATLTLNAYFAQTWDVKTFIQAAHRFLDGGNPFDLYAQSRAAQTWPYAYPPLHALATAIFLWIGNFVTALPDYVWARVPALIADIGVGILLYALVVRKSSDESLARMAMLLWLFNPVTFYATAVQGHFESEWIFFVMLAYMWFEKSHGIVLPAAALAFAVLFKQVAILFAILFWLCVLLSPTKVQRDVSPHPSSLFLHPIARTGASLLIFSLVIIAVCLPYFLYSNDFLYMNLTYLENVPTQTQSWLVGVLALARPAQDAMTSDFFLFRYQTIVTVLAAAAISYLAIRRGHSLYLTAALVSIAFFLTSKKVMGYYYVMLVPFLFAEILPRRRFALALLATVLTAWISLSPYYAPWADPDHIWVYAVLGTINSALFVWMFKITWMEMNAEEPKTSSGVDLRSLLFVTLALFIGAALAALLQPLAPDGGSPIRRRSRARS